MDDYINDALKTKMGLPTSVFPSAEEVRSAQLKFACTREDNLVEYRKKMEEGKDTYAASVMGGLVSEIVEAAFRGEVHVNFKWGFASARPRHDRDNEFYMDTPIAYSDSTFHSFEDYLDAMTYLHALCEFLYDSLESLGYEVCAPRAYNHRRPNSGDDIPSTREEIIRAAFTDARADTFNFVVAWGDEEFRDAVSQMETMAQYESYAAGVPIEDILA